MADVVTVLSPFLQPFLLFDEPYVVVHCHVEERHLSSANPVAFCDQYEYVLEAQSLQERLPECLKEQTITLPVDERLQLEFLVARLRHVLSLH